MKRAWSLLPIGLVCLSLTSCIPLIANPSGLHLSLTPTPPKITGHSYMVLDAHSGKIIAEQNADKKASPASLTKMMTAYVIFHALKAQQIHLDDQVSISKKAWKMKGSRMFVEPRHKVSVDRLLQGIIVSSGNDACVAMAEYVAGSEEAFTDLMNQTAAYLGMKDSHFTDSTGLPHPNHYSTPHDLATLANHIIHDFPEYYHYFKQKKLSYNHITQSNRNLLLWRDPSVDGLKTGHTDTAGYCLVSSAQKDGQRIIVVELGAKGERQRAQDSMSLMTWAFRFYQSKNIYTANVPVQQVRVWGGNKNHVAIGSTHDIYVTTLRNNTHPIKTTITYTEKTARPPVKKGDALATATITQDGKALATVPLVALSDDPRGGFFSRMFDGIAMRLHNWFA